MFGRSHNASSPTRRASLAVILCAVSLSACFESGPLDTSSAGLGPADAESDAPADSAMDAAPDLSLPDTVDTDPVVPPDADAVVPPDADAVVPPDTDGPDLDTSVTDTSPVRSCLTHDDCVGIPVVDLCSGPIRCVDYGCRPDPTAPVACDNGGDACIESTCNPTTGGCESRSLCTCESLLSLPCNATSTWFTNEPGTRPAFDALGACPASAGSPVRILHLTAPSGRVRLDAGVGVQRYWVLDAESCDGEACLVGGEATTFFDAVEGRTYAIAVEEDDPMTASMQVTCGIVREDRCSNGLDDDGDGLTDCDDPDCDNIDGCVRPPDDEVGLCDNGIDDDSDGFTDCADLDCDSDPSCLQSCEIPSGASYCNFSQGLGTGGGKARSTHYSCNPIPQSSKEVVYKFRPDFSGTVRIGFQTSANLTLHLLRETGRGCTPRDCVGMATGDLWFEAVADTMYYAVIDGPGSTTGSFNIVFDCDP